MRSSTARTHSSPTSRLVAGWGKHDVVDHGARALASVLAAHAGRGAVAVRTTSPPCSMPALAAWTAFLLCRYLTRPLWPSLVGGYLFGFSSYVLGARRRRGDLNLERGVRAPARRARRPALPRRELTGRGLVVRLGPLLALQLLISRSHADVLARPCGGLSRSRWPSRPRGAARVLRSSPPLAGSYVVAGVPGGAVPVLPAPPRTPRGPFYAPDKSSSPTSRISVVPTKIHRDRRRLAEGRLVAIPRATSGSKDAYLGLPVLLIVGLFARRPPTPGGRFLLGLLARGGCRRRPGVAGARSRGARSWRCHGPSSAPGRLFQNVLTARIAVYVALPRRRGRGAVDREPGMAAFFVGCSRGSRCWRSLRTRSGEGSPRVTPSRRSSPKQHLPPRASTRGATVLPLPIRGGNSRLWQVDSGFRFKPLRRRHRSRHPGVLLHARQRPDLGRAAARHGPGGGALAAFIDSKHVTKRLIVDVAVTRPRLRERRRTQVAAPHPVGSAVALPPRSQSALVSRRLSAMPVFGAYALARVLRPRAARPSREREQVRRLRGTTRRSSSGPSPGGRTRSLHGENPFVTHAGRGAGRGQPHVDRRPFPGSRFCSSPLTLLVGTTLSYDVAAVVVAGARRLDGVPALPPPDALLSGRRLSGGTCSGSRATCWDRAGAGPPASERGVRASARRPCHPAVSRPGAGWPGAGRAARATAGPFSS